MLAVTTILVAFTGTYLKAAVLESLQVYQDESVLAIPFLLMTDDAVKYMLKARANTESTEPQETEWEVQEQPETIPPKKEMPETEPVEIPTEPVEITEEWFDDALFIGDSRILGMRYQRRLGNADYFTQMSMRKQQEFLMPFKVMDKAEEQLKNLDIVNTSDQISNTLRISRRNNNIQKDFFSMAEYLV